MPINSGHLIWWLRRQLDEAEQLATNGRALSGERWTALEITPRHVTWEVMGVSRKVAEMSGWEARHIARHDPASVLADVAAKRRTVDLCEQWLNVGADSTRYLALTVLREMAMGLADRDGFDEGWRTT